jgi:hypothetical protein
MGNLLRAFPVQVPLLACGIYLALTVLCYAALIAYLTKQEHPVFIHGHFWQWAAVSMLLWFVSFTLAWFILIPKPPYRAG